MASERRLSRRLARQLLRRPSLLASAALLLACGAPPLVAQAALPEAVDFANSADVGDEPEAARLAFYRAEEHLTAGRAREAGDEVIRLLRGATIGRVRVGERLVVPLETAALLFLLRLPPDVREALAREEAAVVGAPPRGGDPAALRAFAARHPLQPAAERAQLEAGLRELLAGRFATAVADLERLVHWPSAGPGAARALAAARLLEAHARLAAELPQEPLARWPEGAAVVAHADAAAPADLAAWRARAEAATRPPFDFGLALPTFAHLFTPPPSQEPLRDPEYALHRNRFLLVQHQTTQDEPELKDLPTRAPLVAGERFITLEPLVAGEGGPVALRVRSLATGADLFAPIRSDFDLHLDPEKDEVVLDRAGLSLDGEALFLTLELREPGQAARELLNSGQSARTALFRLDLAREGYVDFRVTSDDLAAQRDFAGHVFSGPAVACDGRLLVAASRLEVKESVAALLCFDAQSGAPLEATFLARAAAIPRVASRFGTEDARRVNPSPVVVEGGLAFVCTNLGVIAAVRAADATLAWQFRYHRAVPPEGDRYERSARHDLGPWIGRAPIALPDRVVASPADSHYLYSLSRWPSEQGHLLLNEPIEKQQRLCLLGADASRCFFVRREADDGGLPSYQIEATDHDGARLWNQSISVLKGNRITGVPALTRRWLFVPTDRCIYRVDLEGGLLASIAPPAAVGVPYPEYGTFGDLALAGDALVSTSASFTLLFR